MCAANENPAIIQRLWKKAKQSPSQYRISCVALDRKGEVLGYTTNKFRKDEINPVIGSGLHAEAFAMARYYPLGIKTLLIMRIGLSGAILPIDPCEDCQKMARKLGIKIRSVMPGVGAKKKFSFIKKNDNNN